MSKPLKQKLEVRKACGFRMSVVDGAVILLAVVLTAGLHPWLGEMSWLFVIVSGHFFLFCNVFRIRRAFELLWAGLFVLNVGVWYTLEALNWWWVLAVQSPVTLLFIAISFFMKDYHGIFWNLAPRPRQLHSMGERQSVDCRDGDEWPCCEV